MKRLIAGETTSMACAVVVVVAIVILGFGAGVASAESLYVDSGGGWVPSQPLTSGVEYTIEASGTYYFWLPNPNVQDPSWAQGIQGDPAWTVEVDSLHINGLPVLWSGTTDGTVFTPHTFSPSHIYRYGVLGTGQPLGFNIADSDYAGNSGGFQVTITETGSGGGGEGLPEPSAFALLGVGAIGLLAIRRKLIRQ